MVKDIDLIEAMRDLHDELVYYLVKQLINEGRSINEIQLLLDKGMKAVGEKYENEEYYLGDLICSGLIYDTVLKMDEMRIYSEKNSQTLGKVVVGTASGDVHDLGKSIFINTLSSNGFDVIDIGVDQSSASFVSAVKKYKPDILAISGILSSSIKSIGNIVSSLKQNGLRDDLMIIIGGNQAMEEVIDKLGVDAYGADAMIGTELCLKYIKEK